MQATQNKNNDKKKAVLFIDDEKMVLEIGSLMLQKLGYSVLIASNGHKAIKILKKNKVAFVILDMLMPGMNGYEIYHQLKKIQPKVKILIASGYPGDQSEMRLESIGFNGYLQKPFNLKQLSEKIDNIWEN
ncbi:MAG: response regulator [Desulfobacterales bacterium]|jgi:CheY-like chemotaxis protein|nr:response regulator [Desulfobacterales bacterium]